MLPCVARPLLRAQRRGRVHLRPWTLTGTHGHKAFGWAGCPMAPSCTQHTAGSAFSARTRITRRGSRAACLKKTAFGLGLGWQRRPENQISLEIQVPGYKTLARSQNGTAQTDLAGDSNASMNLPRLGGASLICLPFPTTNFIYILGFLGRCSS